MPLVLLLRNALAGLRVLIGLTLLVGVIYPVAVLGVAQVVFPWRADGSLVTTEGAHTTDPSAAAGSILIGQEFAAAQWFHSRPSAAGEGWDTLASGGSNLGPESRDLVAAVKERRAQVAAEEGIRLDQVPADAVTASASGLDPDISATYAYLQAPRVAHHNGLTMAVMNSLIDAHTRDRTLGIFGAQRVNVVELNLAVKNLAEESRATP